MVLILVSSSTGGARDDIDRGSEREGSSLVNEEDKLKMATPMHRIIARRQAYVKCIIIV